MAHYTLARDVSQESDGVEPQIFSYLYIRAEFCDFLIGSVPYIKERLSMDVYQYQYTWTQKAFMQMSFDRVTSRWDYRIIVTLLVMVFVFVVTMFIGRPELAREPTAVVYGLLWAGINLVYLSLPFYHSYRAKALWEKHQETPPCIIYTLSEDNIQLEDQAQHTTLKTYSMRELRTLSLTKRWFFLEFRDRAMLTLPRAMVPDAQSWGALGKHLRHYSKKRRSPS